MPLVKFMYIIHIMIITLTMTMTMIMMMIMIKFHRNELHETIICMDEQGVSSMPLSNIPQAGM